MFAGGRDGHEPMLVLVICRAMSTNPYLQLPS